MKQLNFPFLQLTSLRRPLEPRRGTLIAAIWLAFTAFARLASAAGGDVEAGFDPNAASSVFGIAVQADRKILIGGNFRTIGNMECNRIGRLHADGTLDDAFGANLNAEVYSIAVQLDGKILVGGNFTTAFTVNDAVARYHLARFYADGNLDAGFDTILDAEIYNILVQPDDRIVITGSFTTVDGVPRSRIARLHPDGTLDTTFVPPTANQRIISTAMLADGRIVIGGLFTTLGGQTRNRIALLNANGTLDPNFNPNVGPNLNSGVSTIAVQSDGRILIGGSIFRVGGVSRNGIARLHGDGTLDTDFQPSLSGSPFSPESIAVQADGKLVVGGAFTLVNGAPRNRLARFFADGSLDTEFSTEANGIVRGIAVQSEGRIILGGEFTQVGGVARNRIARLENDPGTQHLTAPDRTRVQWLRGGAAPEVGQVSFEISTDAGSTWTLLGSGTRIAGGWELNGLALPAAGQLRARARCTGGEYNGSSGLVETVAAFPSELGEFFRITSVVVEGGNLLLSFPIVTGRRYTLWQSDTMTEDTWTDTGLPAEQGTDASLTFTVPAPASGRRFFRVQSAP